MSAECIFQVDAQQVQGLSLGLGKVNSVLEWVNKNEDQACVGT